jgi:hypothetical protein
LILIWLAEPNEVLIKLNATGICHSDIHFMLNDWGTPKMSAMGTQCAGHEGAGVIVKVGDQVKNLKPGMRAGLKVRRLPRQDLSYSRAVSALLVAKYADGNVSQSKIHGKPSLEPVKPTDCFQKHQQR